MSVMQNITMMLYQDKYIMSMLSLGYRELSFAVYDKPGPCRGLCLCIYNISPSIWLHELFKALFHTAAFKKQYIGYCFLHLHIGPLSGSLQDIFVLSFVVLGSSSQRSV